MIDPDGSNCIEELLGEGWHDAEEDPPDSDRIVQIAWEDGSFGPKTRGFYDGMAEIPDSGRRYWWQFPMTLLPDGSVLAWKELEKGVQ